MITQQDHYQLIAVDLFKQKELDADPRAIQQIEFYGKLETNSQVCTVLEKSKETALEFYKGLPLLKSVIKPLGLLSLTAASSENDAGAQKKIYGSGTTTLVISNEEMNDIMKIVKALEDSNILLKRATNTIK